MGNFEKPDIEDEINKELLKHILNEQKQGVSIQKIEEEISVKIPKVYNEVAIKMTEDYFKYSKDHFYEISLHLKVNSDTFLSHQNAIWYECFAASDTLYSLTVEAAEDYIEFVDKKVSEEEKEKNNNMFLALLNIHGRVCQIYAEILCLIRHGFADGAYGRWRTMFELCCVAYFIKDSGEETAEAYIKQSAKDRNPIWAKKSPLFKNKKDTFKPKVQDIINTCDFYKPWEKSYKLACSINHAQNTSTFGRLSTFNKTNIIPAGSSDYGIVVPAEHSAKILCLTNSVFFSVFYNLDTLARGMMLTKWSEFITELYIKTEKENFKNERKEEN